MIQVENVEVWGFEHAIRGMRNPMNSWDKSDSGYAYITEATVDLETGGITKHPEVCKKFIICKNDMDLMQRLYKGGSEHRKYLRQIMVSMDIIAPIYWWKEADTYRIGVTANSCSTMHKIHANEFTLDDFSHEHLMEYSDCYNDKILWVAPLEVLANTIETLNTFRRVYIKTKDKKYWWQMIQLLPSSYNQKRTVTMNYENVMNMIHQRSGHKLDEWRTFVDVLKGLPYVKEIRGEEDDK